MSYAAFLGAHAAWAWIVFGLVLCGAEILAPGAFLIWIGAAALCLGALAFFYVPPLEWSLVLFAVLAAGFAFVGRRVYGGLERDRGGVILNDRARGLIGRVASLDVGIGAQPGRLRLDDAPWRARGVEAPAGALVKVTGVDADGATLIVEKA